MVEGLGSGLGCRGLGLKGFGDQRMSPEDSVARASCAGSADKNAWSCVCLTQRPPRGFWVCAVSRFYMWRIGSMSEARITAIACLQIHRNYVD